MTHEQLVQDAAVAVRPVFGPGKEWRRKRREELMAKHGWTEDTVRSWASMVVDRSGGQIAAAQKSGQQAVELMAWRGQDLDADNKFCTALYLIDVYRDAGAWAYFTQYVPGRQHFNMAYTLFITLPIADPAS